MGHILKDERIPLTRADLDRMKFGEEILCDGERGAFVMSWDDGTADVCLADGSLQIDVPLADLSVPNHDLIEARDRAERLADGREQAGLDRAYADWHERTIA